MTDAPDAQGSGEPHGHPPLPFDEHLEALSTQECLDYLTGDHVGRVALVVNGIPVILPVSYTIDAGDVIFLTGSGTKLRSAFAGEVAAFEIDNLDAEQRGWSVLLIGEAAADDDPGEVARVRALGLEPAAPGPHDHVVRIHRRWVSGRRFGFAGEGNLRPREP
jgi:nitroimidazol reductase NimA-like FMN-containing flavoprotein (pyridoxamine 5'-phosphate oxidase superfamily)